MPHTIALPENLSTRPSQVALYKALVAELEELQDDLKAALDKAKGERAQALQELNDKDKAALRDLLETAYATLNKREDASQTLMLAVTAYNVIVDGLAAPVEVVMRPAASVTGTHVMPAITDTQVLRPRPAAAPAGPPVPPSRDTRVAGASVPPNPPRGGDRTSNGCTPTADHVLDLIRRMPKAELDKLRKAAGQQGGGFLNTLLTERGGSRRGAHQ